MPLSAKKQPCGCWLDLKHGTVVPVCQLHFNLAVERVKAGAEHGLGLDDFQEAEALATRKRNHFLLTFTV